eukprot:TRINITY_DN1024_c0_g1_i1.p1 TRINITY_DN1024_c0_g1~~TRINITY_DN1024_c0_g1_i1.p1  ORF type:complete len:759 (+),score=166.35 TRINITY_DN1024_c0_g1_i1:50-2326(+)
MAEQFYEAEDRDGVRFSWNIWPSNNAECKRLGLPISCMYSPFKNSDTVQGVTYDPVFCSNNNCQAILNPYCRVDLNTKMWTCPFCVQRNRFPSMYDGMSETNLPAELMPTSTTIEYSLPRGAGNHPPVFVFLVDVCILEEELESVKASLLQVLTLLPENAFVGLITYGATVNVYELAFQYFPKTHVFDGDKEISNAHVQQTLNVGIASSTTPGAVMQPTPKNKYILPLSQVEFSLTSIIEELFPDPTPRKPDQRPQRCTGTAVTIALSLLEYTFPKTACRLITLSGGPATIGQGLVVAQDIKEPIRSHSELAKEAAKHVHKATKYYTLLAEKASRNGHTVDLFSCSLDQTGILEMQDLSKQTGGIIVTSETFVHEQYRKSILKLFEKDTKNVLKMVFNVMIDVKTSRELAISGGIGHFVSTFNKHGNIAEHEVGIGGTSEWKSSCADRNTSYSFYFEVSNPKETVIPPGHHGMVQFKTSYTKSTGQRVVRVTTLAHNWALPDSPPSSLLVGFDQEASAALVARLAIFKHDTEDIDIIRWVDQHLIRFTRRYGIYQKGNESTFRLPPEIGLYPQFMFHLRRCPLVNIFGNSPDETAFFRHYLQRESTSSILTMIQPGLDEYSLSSDEPMPVLLSSTSLKKDVILLLDTFFHVVIWSGDTIGKWRKAGYHQKEEYANLKQLMEAPLEDVKNTLSGRFPYPIYVECDQGTSQARFLLATVDPAHTSTTELVTPGSGEQVNTEDASLQRFMDHLKKFSVQPE